MPGRHALHGRKAARVDRLLRAILLERKNLLHKREREKPKPNLLGKNNNFHKREREKPEPKRDYLREDSLVCGRMIPHPLLPGRLSKLNTPNSDQ